MIATVSGYFIKKRLKLFTFYHPKKANFFIPKSMGIAKKKKLIEEKSTTDRALNNESLWL